MGKKKTAPAPASAPATSGGDPYSEIMGGYRKFAETGGFSPEDIAQTAGKKVCSAGYRSE